MSLSKIGREYEQGLVSVVIATRNRSSLIHEAIDSVLNQTYENYEILIIDDGSTDDTERQVKEFNNPRIVYVFQENHGRSHARNTALKMSKGEYLTFLDDDDLYLTKKIELQIEFMKNTPQCDVLYSEALCFTTDKDKTFMKYSAEFEGNIYDKIALFIPHTICLPTIMLRRNVIIEIGLFDENLNRFEDIDLWRRISKKYPYFAIQQPLCLLRTHQENTIEKLNLANLSNQVEIYVKKVLIEDLEFYGNELIGLCAELMKHYARAIMAQKTGLLVGVQLHLKAVLLLKSPKFLAYFISKESKNIIYRKII